ncbi:MAG: asparagine synthase (glutamine-hydrolyzing), partial [Pseudonocardiaceae bacterium]
MCGLLGLLTAQQDAAQRVANVSAALRCQRHRGPDETGLWYDADVVLGFNRLSIIDLEHSHQPLRWGPPDEPERYTILFNGEIYNYIELREELRRAPYDADFVTDGDTEVVVAAYHHLGPGAVERLRGMFAFVIWDAQQRVAFGGRDPFGIKPLFSCIGPGGVAFASEKKSLLELAPSLGVSTEVDRRALQHYLTLQYVPEPASLSTGITRIESGTSFTVLPGGRVVTARYFQPLFRPRQLRSQADTVALHDEITTAMRDSVAKHMRADVTVGAFLSGGIDSTAIAALAREHNPDLITFTT